MKCETSGSHTISYQSLLLSTTVLNDTHIYIHVLIHSYSAQVRSSIICNGMASI